MKIFTLIILLAVSSCSSSQGGYKGMSAWSKYHEVSRQSKNSTRPAYPNSIRRYIIPEQRRGGANTAVSSVREAPKRVSVKANSNSQRLLGEVPEIVKRNREQVIMQEQYNSAAGSICQRKRSEKNGEMSARIICRYPDGKEYHFSDLTM